MKSWCLLLCLLLFCAFDVNAQNIHAFAGTGSYGFSGDGGPAVAAKFSNPGGIATDIFGNTYICDDYRIRKVNSSGIVSTIAGTGIAGFSGDGGPAASAQIGGAWIATDPTGNIYLADNKNCRIRRVDIYGGITTIAGTGTWGFSGDGGPATTAQMCRPQSICVDGSGNMYVFDSTRIRKIDRAGVISTIAGTGVNGCLGDGMPATAAQISMRGGITTDSSGNLYLTDFINNRVRMINNAGIINLFAGVGSAGSSGDGGPATAAEIYNPGSIAVDRFGCVYISEIWESKVRKVDASGTITTYAGVGSAGSYGDGGPATAAALWFAGGLAVDYSQQLYITDNNDHRIRVIDGYNRPPHFIGGHNQSLAVCENSVKEPINMLLSVIDSDRYLFDSWSVVTVPLHGTVIAVDTVPSSGDTVGTMGLSYTPVMGYAGNDSFKIRVTDGQYSDTTMIHVIVNPLPMPISGANKICVGLTSGLSDIIPGATWTSSNSAIATIGSGSGIVSGISAGSSVISYTTGSGCSAFDTIIVTPHPLPITGVTQICLGNTASLTDGGGGAWSSSNTAIATVVSGAVSSIAPGSAIITYQLSAGCISTVTVNVTAPPLSILGATSVCVGGNITLSDATPFGTWSSSNTAGATIGSATGILTGVTTGIVTISYTVFPGCSATKSVTVNPIALPIMGSLSVCTGFTIILSDASTGGVWTSSNTSVAIVGSGNGIVTGISTGGANITYTVFSGCFAIAAVTVNPLPAAISGAAVVCGGMVINLSDVMMGGTWTSGAPGIAVVGSSTGIVSGISPGTSTISYVSGIGCVAIKIVTVNMSPSFVTGVNHLCIGSTSVLSDPAIGGIWSSTGHSGIVSVDSSTGMVRGITAGTATVTYTLATGCTATMPVTVNTLPAAITGATGLCVGATSALSSSTGGGIWSSSTTAATVSSSGVVSGIAAGMSAITYKIFSTGCLTISTVTVSSTPGVITGTAKVCAGATTILSNTVGGGTWSSSNTTIAGIGPGTGVVTGMSSGTSVITYSTGPGCNTTQTVTVNNMALISGASNICTGQTTTLSNPIAGGIWSSGATAIATIGPGTGVVTGIAAGTATITYLLPSGCATTAVITVNSVPPAITGVMHTCTGQTTTLTNAAAGGTWMSSNISKATVGSGTGIVTGLAAGTAIITYSLGGGCTTTTGVTIDPMPAPIAGSMGVCTGSATTLSDAVGGGTWSAPSSGIMTIGPSSGIVSGSSPGSATITYTLAKGCATTRTMNVYSSPPPITGAGPLCAGASECLSDAAMGGGWTTSSGGVATISPAGCVTTISLGTATITYATGTGCITTTIITISGAPMPITGASSVCEGMTTALSDAVSGGTWSSSDAGIAAIGSSGIVTGMAAGIANITYTTGTGCAVTRTMIVNPVVPITGATTICAGTTTILSDAVTGGTWSSNNTTVATIGMSSGVGAGVTAGTAIISYLTPMGCVSTIPLTVNPLPSAGVITGASDVCVGASIVLTDPAGGGTWSSPDGTVSVSPFSNIITGVSAGTATISYSNTNSCGTAVAIHAVTVNPLPLAGTISGPAEVCVSATIALTDATAGGMWSSADVTVSVGSTSGSVSGISTGTALITYTYANICGSADATYTVTINPLPVAGVIKGTASVCVGATATLTDSVTGGVWVVSNGHSTISGGIVTGVSAGVDTIIYTTSNTCGSAATMHYVTINPLPDAGSITGAASVCAGVSTKLSDAIGGGTWSSVYSTVSIGAAPGMVTGVSAGTATISYAVANTCGMDVATHVVTVNPQPYAGIISGANSVCAGSVIVLTDSISGGVWSAGNNIDSVSAGIVKGISAGVDTIKYAVANMCGTAIATYFITVNPQPDAGTINGPDDVCAGAILLLTEAVTGGTWSSTAGAISIDPVTGMVTGTGPGNATISYSVTNMCGTATAEKIINVVPMPTVSELTGPASVCIGSEIALSDMTGGGMWGTRNGMVSIAAGVVKGVIAGTETIVYSVTNACGNATAIKEITISPLPNAGVINGSSNSICPGDSVVLSGNGAGGVWGNRNGDVAQMLTITNNSVMVVSKAGGTDTISYAVSNLCGTAIATFALTVKPESDCSTPPATDAFDCSGHGELMISPNPTRGTFTINVSSDMQEDVRIVITNMLGQRLETIATVTNAPFDMDLHQPAGVYIVSVVSSHGKCSKKVVVE